MFDTEGFTLLKMEVLLYNGLLKKQIKIKKIFYHFDEK